MAGKSLSVIPWENTETQTHTHNLLWSKNKTWSLSHATTIPSLSSARTMALCEEDPVTWFNVGQQLNCLWQVLPETQTLSTKSFTASHQPQALRSYHLRVDAFTRAPETNPSRKYASPSLFPIVQDPTVSPSQSFEHNLDPLMDNWPCLFPRALTC